MIRIMIKLFFVDFLAKIWIEFVLHSHTLHLFSFEFSSHSLVVTVILSNFNTSSSSVVLFSPLAFSDTSICSVNTLATT